MAPEIPPRGFKPLEGSERSQPANARRIGSVDPLERIEVSVYLRAPMAGNPAGDNREHVQHPGQRMSRDEYLASYSADPDDLAKISAFAREHALTVVETDAARRKVVLAGTAKAMMAAFATKLHRYRV